jgi:hypothetical protein
VSATPKYQLLDPLSEQQYADLKEDIAERGILQPVIVDEFGDVIDGHHRKQIAEELGEDYPTHQLPSGRSETQKLDDSVALNLMGRHQSRDQKRETIKRYLRRLPNVSGQHLGRVVGVDHKTVDRIRDGLIASGEIPQSPDRVGSDGRTYAYKPKAKPSTPPRPDPEAVARRQADLAGKRAKAQAKQAANKAEEQADLAQLVEDWTARGGAVRASLKPQARAVATQDRIKAAMNDCILALTRALTDPGLDEDLIRAERDVAKDYQITKVHARLKKLVNEFGTKLKELQDAEKTSRMAQEAPVRET